MSFSGDLGSFADRTRISMDKVVRKIGMDMTRDIVRATPVDTGMARSNYFPGYVRDGSIDQTTNTSGAPSMARMTSFTENLRAGGVFYITNNLPYIMRLEFGYSQQAPAGMARITVDRWQERVNRIVREVNP